MAKTPKARVTGEHYIDLQLWATAQYLLGIGVRAKKGKFHPLLAASVFAFFAFEAYLNEVGRQLDPKVWGREREFFAKGKYQGPLGKFKYLAAKTGYQYSSGTRPFQTVRGLAKVRDLLAHGRMETFDVRTSVNRADAIGLTPKIMEWGHLSFAKKAVVDIESLADGLMIAAKHTYGEWAVGYRSSAFVGISSSRSIHLEG